MTINFSAFLKTFYNKKIKSLIPSAKCGRIFHKKRLTKFMTKWDAKIYLNKAIYDKIVSMKLSAFHETKLKRIRTAIQHLCNELPSHYPQEFMDAVVKAVTKGYLEKYYPPN